MRDERTPITAAEIKLPEVLVTYYAAVELAHRAGLDTARLVYLQHALNRFGFIDCDTETLAWLHPLLHHSDLTSEELRAKFGDPLAEAVIALTPGSEREVSERKRNHYRRLALNPPAIVISVAALAAAVELAVLEGDHERFDRLRDEYPDYRATFFDRCLKDDMRHLAERLKELWGHLDRLLDFKCEPQDHE